mgnify:CR=1 FL=1
MKHFLRHASDQLYKLDPPSRTPHEVYLVLPAPLSQKEAPIPLSEAVRNATGHNGLLVFTGQAMNIANQGRADWFVDQILAIFHARARTDRAFLWLLPNWEPDQSQHLFMGVNRDATCVTSSLQVPLVTDLGFVAASGAKMTFDNDGIRLASASPCVAFFGPRAPKGYDVHAAFLSLTGDLPGSFSYDAYFSSNSFLSCLDPGFSMSWPAGDPEGDGLRTINFPLFARDSASAPLGFRVLICPAQGRDGSSRLDLLCQEKAPKLRSCFLTIYGSPVYLQPSGFVFCIKPAHALPLCPDGDFRLYGPTGQEEPLDLMCGISGMEYLRFSPGDALRFSWGCPGFAPVFPPAPSSVVAKPVDPEEELVDRTFSTSWACLSRSASPLYMTQPAGMCYYGTRDLSGPYPQLLFQTETFRHAPKDVLFPLFPFGGITEDRLPAEILETQIISPLRLNRLTRSFIPEDVKTGQITPAATPNGFLAHLDAQGFAGIYLANNDYMGANRRLFFEKPSQALTAAFQSNPLFLVINNPLSLGIFTSDSSEKGCSAFHNSINIGDWLFSFEPGQGNEYNDYKTVMIVKGCKGRLYDPDLGGLASAPQAWTRWQDFAPPLFPHGPDKDQLVNLSTWLNAYCRLAANGDPRYFSQFNRIASDENWQGILFLNVPLSRDNLPRQLGGVLMGLPPGSGITAHHIGIHMTALKQDANGLGQDGLSSLFGLIHYEDPEFKETKEPVSPEKGLYGFRLLSLKALFVNSALKDFENYAQLTVGSWLGQIPDRMEGGRYSSMLLKGACQVHDGKTSYGLRGVSDCLYRFDHGPLSKVEVTQIKMDASGSSCGFLMEGFLDFRVLGEFDLFSYGNLPGEDLTKQGLCFSNLELSMTRTNKEGVCVTTWAFLTDQLSLDPGKGFLRPKSLARCLSLKPEGMEQSRPDRSFEDLGYLPVQMAKSFGAIEKDWFGLRLSLPMGTLGQLASPAAINAGLLLAFGPGGPKEEPKIALWIKLPGSGQKAGFLNLQNLMSLSVQQIRLEQEQDRFQLKLTDLSLKLFSLLTIPPKGSTDLTVFGGGQADGEPGWFAKYQKHPPKKEDASDEKRSLSGAS